MLGAIIGDTVGSVYEFNNTKNYNFPLFTSESEYTDDSILTAAVTAWALHDKTYSMKSLETYLLDFVQAFPNPMGSYGASFSRWAFHPEQLYDFYMGKSDGRQPYNSFGNGSAMRAPGLGWLFDTLEETERVAGLSAAITHNHPEGIKGAQATAVAVYLARTGVTKEKLKKEIESRYGYDLSDTWEHLHEVYSWDSSCQGTVPQAIIAFLESTDFESAIRLAVAMGGDSDTIACITGGIAEAYYKEIPEKMVQHVLSILPPKLLNVLHEMSTTAYGECLKKYVR